MEHAQGSHAKAQRAGVFVAKLKRAMKQVKKPNVHRADP
jgi:hypothetical protein